MNRLKELDFLRGIAIILVMLRHKYISEYTTNMGWIGVDLFFVLSGFLVSGLLFREYIKFGNIEPKRFLIRRGFKIYPIYFISYPLYLLPILLFEKFKLPDFLSDMTFTQNYYRGWGYANLASWSLAIEEHFYFLFAILLFLGLKYKKIILEKSKEIKNKRSSMEVIIVLTFIICLMLRIHSNIVFHDQILKNITMTHLRMDSLLAGTFIAYLYYFRINFLTNIFQSNKYLLGIIAFLGLSWTPFVDLENSFFAKTFGFTLLYISFGLTLIFFLLTGNINQKLNTFFSTILVNGISKIGKYSYSIYIIHSFIIRWFQQFTATFQTDFHIYWNFLITSTLSIFIGMLMTNTIENYFLKIRDQYFPSRV